MPSSARVNLGLLGLLLLLSAAEGLPNRLVEDLILDLKLGAPTVVFGGDDPLPELCATIKVSNFTRPGQLFGPGWMTSQPVSNPCQIEQRLVILLIVGPG